MYSIKQNLQFVLLTNTYPLSKSLKNLFMKFETGVFISSEWVTTYFFSFAVYIDLYIWTISAKAFCQSDKDGFRFL